jgi:hypothetical protein
VEIPQRQFIGLSPEDEQATDPGGRTTFRYNTMFYATNAEIYVSRGKPPR